jgi:hypothetical protein
MTGDDSTIPAPIPVITRLGQYPPGDRERNVPRPRELRVPDPAGDSTGTLTAGSVGGCRRLHGDLGSELLLEDAGDELLRAGRCKGHCRRADAGGRTLVTSRCGREDARDEIPLAPARVCHRCAPVNRVGEEGGAHVRGLVESWGRRTMVWDWSLQRRGELTSVSWSSWAEGWDLG